jgi:hypothetical protein
MECAFMPKKAPRKKRVARPRVLWQVNPTTRVEASAKSYRRRKPPQIRVDADDEQET